MLKWRRVLNLRDQGDLVLTAYVSTDGRFEIHGELGLRDKAVIGYQLYDHGDTEQQPFAPRLTDAKWAAEEIVKFGTAWNEPIFW